MLGHATPRSAENNIVYPMRRLGLIDEDGTLTPRGNKWRVDSSYPDACQEILDEIYPDELAGFVDNTGSPDVSEVKNWFQHKGLGESNARQMASTYVMIAQKKIPEAAAGSQPRTRSQPVQPRAGTTTAARRSSRVVKQTEQNLGQTAGDKPSSANGPNIHFDIQIHIPADASADQIDHIFASMAKHLYRT